MTHSDCSKQLAYFSEEEAATALLKASVLCPFIESEHNRTTRHGHKTGSFALPTSISNWNIIYW